MILLQENVMINVGIIGSGFIGPAHIEALRRLGFVQVVALCDGSQALAEEKAKELNIPHAYGSVEALLAHPDLHVVHNCTPNHLHAQINRQILRAGKHVFSEKPLCMTPEEARELVALAEQAGVIHGVSFVYRQFAMVRRVISDACSPPTAAICRTGCCWKPTITGGLMRRSAGRRVQ
jgi:predicted dehydrogenase